jgi:hypothetical protein
VISHGLADGLTTPSYLALPQSILILFSSKTFRPQRRISYFFHTCYIPRPSHTDSIRGEQQQMWSSHCAVFIQVSSYFTFLSRPYSETSRLSLRLCYCALQRRQNAHKRGLFIPAQKELFKRKQK